MSQRIVACYWVLHDAHECIKYLAANTFILVSISESSEHIQCWFINAINKSETGLNEAKNNHIVLYRQVYLCIL